MKFALKEETCRLQNVNPRPELHGENPKPAADLKLEVTLPNDELAQFDRRLKPFLYEKETSQPDLISQADTDHLTQLRFPALGLPLKWAGEQVGGKLIVHRGIGPKSDLVIEDPIVNEFRIEPLEGGSVVVTFRVQFHPDEKAIGKLCMLTGTDIVVSVEPPKDVEDELADEGKPPVLLERTREGDVVA